MYARYRLLRFLKFAAFFVSIFYIAWHISNKPELHDPALLFVPFQKSDNLLLLLIVILLMMLNWSIEAFKWKKLLESVEYISIAASLRAVLSGVTVSFYTPNRIGEFAGRILHLEPEHRVKGALATFVGSTAQVMITFQAGLLAFYVFRNQFIQDLNYSILIPVIILILLLPVLWLQIPHLAHLHFSKKILRRFPRYLEVFDHFNRRQLIQVYLLSAFRYFVFCTQQYFLLQMTGFNGSWMLSSGLSALSFLLITIIPSFAIGELGMRSGINLYVFNPWFDNVSGILFTTFMLWLINLAIPALMGATGLLYVKIRKSE